MRASRSFFNTWFAIWLLLCSVDFTSAQAVTLTEQEQLLANSLVNSPGQQRKFLELDPTLTKVARERAADMARRGYFGHVNPDGNAANYLIKAAGYPLPDSWPQARDLNYVESIAAGRPSAFATWNDFMDSEGHRKHLLGEIDFYRKQTSYGVGYVNVPGSKYVHYWVILTAPPRPALPVTITSPPPKTKLTTSQVTVTGQTEGNDPPASRVEVRIENSIGTSQYQEADGLTNWSAVVTNLAPGENTIRARSLDASGNQIAEVTRTVIYAVVTPLTVSIVGDGTVTAGFLGQTEREVATEYSITAKPAAGSLFAGWSGGLTSPKATVKFTMTEGLELVANFVANPFLSRRGSYSGAITSADPTQATSGLINLSLTPKGTFTGKLKLGRTAYPVSGQFDSTGNATVTIKRRNKAAISVSLTLDISGPGGISAVVTDGTFTVTAEAFRSLGKSSGAFAHAGRYTLSLPRNTTEMSTNIPQGNGFATVTVDRAGRVQMLAKLADGTSFSNGGTVSENGTFAIYSSLYSGNGAVVGKFQFNSTSVSDLEGTIRWVKEARPKDRFYPNGFATTVPVVGSRYTVPSPGTPVVRVNPGEGNTELALQEGNLSSPVTQPLTLEASNRVHAATSGLSVKIAPKNGLFRGTFKHPSSGKTHAIQGVIFQKQNAGFGFFLGIDQSGYTSLTPK